MEKDTGDIGMNGKEDARIFSLRKQMVFLAFMVLALLFTLFYAIISGSYPISVQDVIHIVLDHLIPAFPDYSGERVVETVVWNMRVPRVLMAVATGAALAVAGAVYQGCFRNPLVDPFILGVSSGAAFGAALGIVFPSFFLSIQFSAFFFAALAVVAAYLLSRSRGYSPPLTLILAGIVMGSVFDGLVSVMKYISDDTALRTIVFWIMGGLYYCTWSDVLLIVPVVFLALVILILLSWKLNILSIGEEEAQTLGVDPRKYLLVFVGIATLLTALVTSVVGIIPWIGLMMPHAARMITGSDHRAVIPAAVLLGGIYLLVCDTLARTLTSSEIPVGIIVSILGAPYLFWLIRSKGGNFFG